MMELSPQFVKTALALLPAMVKDIEKQIADREAAGEPADDGKSCDYLNNPKARQVLAVCSMVPKGKVTTYGVISKVLEAYEEKAAGKGASTPKGIAKGARKSSVPPAASYPRYSRFVGTALHKNPFAPHVPCHRVVAHDGKLNGFAGGLCKKKELLLSEGVRLKVSSDELERCVVDRSSFVE